MSWPKIILYYVLAAVFAVVLSRSTADESTADQAPVLSPLLQTLPSRIDRVRLERGDDVVEFVRKDGVWGAEGRAAAVHTDGIEAVLDTLANIPPISQVAEKAEAPGEFGLNPARLRMRMDSGGEMAATLAIGERNPTRTAFYVRRTGDERVYLMGLNAHYYIDLILETAMPPVRRSADPAESGDAGSAVAGTSAAAEADAATPGVAGDDSGGEAASDDAASDDAGSDDAADAAPAAKAEDSDPADQRP